VQIVVFLEKFELIKLAKQYKLQNPLCKCGKRMKSAGSDKGYKCPSCGTKLRDGKKEAITIPRNIKEGFYETSPAARRHLSKPIIRDRSDR